MLWQFHSLESDGKAAWSHCVRPRAYQQSVNYWGFLRMSAICKHFVNMSKPLTKGVIRSTSDFVSTRSVQALECKRWYLKIFRVWYKLQVFLHKHVYTFLGWRSCHWDKFKMRSRLWLSEFHSDVCSCRIARVEIDCAEVTLESIASIAGLVPFSTVCETADSSSFKGNSPEKFAAPCCWAMTEHGRHIGRNIHRRD